MTKKKKKSKHTNAKLKLLAPKYVPTPSIKQLEFIEKLSHGMPSKHPVMPAIRQLVEAARKTIPIENVQNENIRKPIVAIIGDFNAGKSSFINSLFQRPVCPVNAKPTTSSITTFRYSKVQKILANGSQTTISQSQYEAMVAHGSDSEGTKVDRISVEYFLDADILKHVDIMDTPGFNNNKNKHDRNVTIKALLAADIVICVIDGQRADITKNLETEINEIRKIRPGMIFGVVVSQMGFRTRKAFAEISEPFKKKHKKSFDLFLPYDSSLCSTGNEQKIKPDELNYPISNFPQKNFECPAYALGLRNLFIRQLERLVAAASEQVKAERVKAHNKDLDDLRNQCLKIYKDVQKLVSIHEVMLKSTLRLGRASYVTPSQLKKNISIAIEDAASDATTVLEREKPWYRKNKFVQQFNRPEFIASFCKHRKLRIIDIKKLSISKSQKLAYMEQKIPHLTLRDITKDISKIASTFLTDKIIEEAIAGHVISLNSLFDEFEKDQEFGTEDEALEGLNDLVVSEKKVESIFESILERIDFVRERFTEFDNRLTERLKASLANERRLLKTINEIANTLDEDTNHEKAA
jgi:ribosome biogenesis GTPase A